MPGDDQRMRRLLILSRFGALGASSRVRMYQFVGHFREANWDVVVSPLVEDDYLEELYRNGRRSAAATAKGYLKRVLALFAVRRFDLVWLEKELFPFLPGFVERALACTGVPYVVDYDDAVFHRYDQHRLRIIRWFLGSKLEGLLKHASLVTVGNAYLRDYALNVGARKLELIPTVVDLSQYVQVAEPAGPELRIGWIGTPITMPYLEGIGKALEWLAQRHKARLVVVGGGEVPRIEIPVELQPWSRATEAALLSGVHVGIMPLPDDPWERGKCGYKLIQYMAAGRPVIGSPVGVNNEIVTPDVGFLAGNDEEWKNALSLLAGDRTLRLSMGAAGRRKVQREYSLSVVGPRLVRMLGDVID